MELLCTVITGVLVPLCVTALGALVRFLKSKTESEKTKTALSSASEVVKETVLEVAQVFVDDLKKEGVFDESAKKEAMSLAKEKARVRILPEVQTLITALYGDFESWLLMKIEASVAKEKA